MRNYWVWSQGHNAYLHWWVVDSTQDVRQDQNQGLKCASEKNVLTTKDTLTNVDLWEDTKTEEAVILKYLFFTGYLHI